ncbi:MAG TPA: 50S ribosomal protein L11 methyltransferase, partial [Sphingomonas sp.]|nr:50S ribosomal protein L11 methyltransferase [Sphingomonas sp.]
MASWKLTLPCTRAEAEAIEAEELGLLGIDPTPVLMTSERVEDDPDSWQLEAFFDSKPNSGALDAVARL